MKSTNKEFKFTYLELKNFLTFAKNIAPITALRDSNNKNVIILRHDVDFCLSFAYNIAKIEKKLDINSSFFVRTTCHTYNPLSSINRKIITKLNKDGFEIGLHFDPIIYGNINHNELKNKVEFECKILENIIHEPITSISLHNPSISGKYPIFKGYNNAYSRDIFSDECYLSDSCMNFRGKDPYDFVQKVKKFPLQIVIHPMHWSEKESEYIDIFNHYIHNQVDYIDTLFRDNYTYRQCILNNKLSNYIFEGKKHGN